MFEVVIQLGAILAVVILFANQIFPFGAPEGSHTVRRRQAKHAHRRKKSGNGILSYVKMDIIILWLKILVACIPAIVIGMPFNDLFEKWFYNYPCVAIAADCSSVSPLSLLRIITRANLRRSTVWMNLLIRLHF